MALTLRDYSVTMTFRDTAGDETTRRIALRGATHAEALADAQAVVAAYDAMTDALIVQYEVNEAFVEDTATLPAVVCEIENQALLDFEIDGDPRKTATHKIPAPVQGVFVGLAGPSRNIVDTGAAIVQTFRDLFTTTGEATISDGESVQTLKSGRRVHKGTRIG